MVHPLPGGEGRGEGERSSNTLQRFDALLAIESFAPRQRGVNKLMLIIIDRLWIHAKPVIVFEKNDTDGPWNRRADRFRERTVPIRPDEIGGNK